MIWAAILVDKAIVNFLGLDLHEKKNLVPRGRKHIFLVNQHGSLPLRCSWGVVMPVWETTNMIAKMAANQQ